MEGFKAKYCADSPYLKSLTGVNHLALISSDIKKTMDFCNKLGLKLVKVLKSDAQNGHYHFFFDIGNGSCLAYFWFPDSPKQHPGISTVNQKKMFKSIATAHGSMNHVAIGVNSMESLLKLRKNFKKKKLNPTAIWYHHENGVDLKYDKDKTQWASTYVFGPDGEWIEFTFQNIDLSQPHIVNIDIDKFLSSKL